MVMFPMVLLGSALGVQINVILPDAIVLISLTLVLIFLSVESTIESIKIRRKENKILAEKNKKQAKEAISVEVLQENNSREVHEDHGMGKQTEHEDDRRSDEEEKKEVELNPADTPNQS
mmetsp:Transcript_43584/g.51328  ORF Transcript_43584/g.51328 Transcript_43584/m.51328 type:complete len:119 (+) Transcript_43584:282-638(+)